MEPVSYTHLDVYKRQVDIPAVAHEVIVLHDHDLDIQIAVWPAVGAAFTLAGYPQLLTGLDASRDLDVDAHAFMFITLAAALGAFLTDFLTRAAAVRADTLGPVSYTHLDVYKRQLQFHPSLIQRVGNPKGLNHILSFSPQ